MNMILTFCLGLAVAAVVAVLALGLFSLAMGGDFNRKYGNRLMIARVALQALALFLLGAAYFLT